MKTAEEVFKEQLKTLKRIDPWVARSDFRTKEEILQLMQEYAQEYHQDKIKALPDDEEIRLTSGYKVECEFMSPKWEMYVRGFQQGAEWMRNQMNKL